jgi:putative toxin-antitoxin system antitoxin component (TIGR02293 family)
MPTTSSQALRPTLLGPKWYLDVFRATPQQRIDMIKAGVPARDAKLMLRRFTGSHARAFEALNVSQSTVNRRAQKDQVLSADISERILGVAKLVGQVQAMVEESGDPQGFDAAAWLSTWIEEPLPALGGARPVDIMDTMEGQALVSTLLAQIQSGAYA